MKGSYTETPHAIAGLNERSHKQMGTHPTFAERKTLLLDTYPTQVIYRFKAVSIKMTIALFSPERIKLIINSCGIGRNSE